MTSPGHEATGRIIGEKSTRGATRRANPAGLRAGEEAEEYRQSTGQFQRHREQAGRGQVLTPAAPPSQQQGRAARSATTKSEDKRPLRPTQEPARTQQSQGARP